MCGNKKDIKCPRCGYELVIPFKPRDCNVEKVWDMWCPTLRSFMGFKATY